MLRLFKRRGSPLAAPAVREPAPALSCGIDPDRCPLEGRVRSEPEPDLSRRLFRHFEQPGSALVFMRAGWSRGILCEMLREAGVEVIAAEEARGAYPDARAAEAMGARMLSARDRGRKVAVFASGVGVLGSAGGCEMGCRLMLSSANLVLAMDADEETGTLFGLLNPAARPGGLEPDAAELVLEPGASVFA